MKQYIYFFAVVAVLAAWSCGKDVPDVPSGLITLSAADSKLLASAQSHTTLKAHIDPKSDVRSIVFKTSKGRLVYGNTSSTDSVVVAADVNGDATVMLYADTTPGDAMALVYILKEDYRAECTVKILSDADYYASETLSILLSDTAIQASHAQTYCDITAIMQNGPMPATLNFYTTKGTFLNLGSVTGTSVSVTANPSGHAVVRLLADSVPGIAFVSVACGAMHKDTLVKFKH